MNSRVINSPEAPEAIGPYSHAIRAGDIIFLSGQLPVDPKTGKLVGTDPLLQARQVFTNLQAVANTAGGDLGDIVKLTIYLSDLRHFAAVNEVMTRFFTAPYPARATIGVAALPKDALIEVEAVMVSGELRFN